MPQAVFKLRNTFQFDAAHRLEDYKGACARLHGHTYKLEVVIEGKIGKDNMVEDFSKIKKVVQDKVISKLDHNYLNDIVVATTAEGLCQWIWNELQNDFSLVAVKLWETPNNCAEFNGVYNYESE